jgi:hypothetical protein
MILGPSDRMELSDRPAKQDSNRYEFLRKSTATGIKPKFSKMPNLKEVLIMNPWIKYNEAVLAILNVVKQTVPLTGGQRRRVDEAKELVEAAIDIIAIEDDEEYDDDDLDDAAIDDESDDDSSVLQ